MMHIIFDDVYRSCVIGRYKRDFTQKENHQGGYLRGCHKIYKVYALYGSVSYTHLTLPTNREV